MKGLTSRHDTCIVLGNGPSMRGFDFHKLDGFATLGMNAAYRHWDRIGWYPTYYACLDDQLIKTHHVEIERLYADGLVKKVFVHGSFFDYHPKWLGHPDFTSLDQTSAYWYEKNGKALGLEPLYERPAFKMSEPSKITTGSHSIRYVANLGFGRVVLLGIDLRYVEIIPEAEATGGIGLVIKTTPKTNPNYFFDSYQQAGDLYNVPNPESHQNKLHERSLELIPIDFSQNEVPCKVYNANRQSILSDKDIFPFVPVEGIIGDIRLGCVFIPTNSGEIEAIIDNFRLWATPAFSPSIEESIVERPHLVFVFNNRFAKPLQERIEISFLEHGMNRYFSELRFEYLDLEGARDAYIRDYTQPVGDAGYKAGPNNQFFQSIRRVGKYGYYAFLMETDCVPVRRGWLSRLLDIVQDTQPFWIMGSAYRGVQNLSKDFVRHLNGNSIYAAGDPEFQTFLTDFWEHNTWRLIQQQDKRLAYDCILEIMFSEPHVRDPAVMGVWKNTAHRLRYTDFIQNISGAEDISGTDATLVTRLRKDHPDTYILHNRAAHGLVVGALNSGVFKQRTFDPRNAASLGYSRLLVVDMTPIGNGTATGEIKANLLADWPAAALLQVCRNGDGLSLVRKTDKGYSTLPATAAETTRAIEEFRPEVILYRPLPDSPTLHDFAMKVIQTRNLPLISWIMDDWPASVAVDNPEAWTRMQPDLLDLLKRSALRLSISEAMSDAFARRYGLPFVPLANGIDPSDWPERVSHERSGLTLRYSGGLALNMNRESVLRVAEAVQKLADRGHPIRFEINTQKWWHEQCQGLFAAFPATVLDVARRSSDDYRAWLQEADALLIAYNFDADSLRYTRYSLANKVPECLASGAPILAHGPMEAATVAALAANDTAIIVDEPSLERLEQALLALLNAADGNAALVERSRASAFARYDIHERRETLRKVIKRIAVQNNDVPQTISPKLEQPRANYASPEAHARRDPFSDGQQRADSTNLSQNRQSIRLLDGLETGKGDAQNTLLLSLLAEILTQPEQVFKLWRSDSRLPRATKKALSELSKTDALRKHFIATWNFVALRGGHRDMHLD